MTFEKIFWAICIGISLIVIITAVTWTPFGDIDLKNTFQIINATNISASYFIGDGSQLTDLTHSLDDAYNDGSVINVDDTDFTIRLYNGTTFEIIAKANGWDEAIMRSVNDGTQDIIFSGNLRPYSSASAPTFGTSDLGTSSKRWRNLFVLNASVGSIIGLDYVLPDFDDLFILGALSGCNGGETVSCSDITNETCCGGVSGCSWFKGACTGTIDDDSCASLCDSSCEGSCNSVGCIWSDDNLRWHSLYLSGNLNDGTNSLTVANAKTAYDLTTNNTFVPYTGAVSNVDLGNYNITANYLSGNLTWNDLYNYPVACPAYSAVTQVNDSITCTDSWVHRDGDTMTGNLIVNANFTVSSPDFFVNSNLSRVGIGTVSPQQKLNVVGDVNVTGNLTLGQTITFAFGEIIDNIVDGWLRITGNLNVTGNVTAENVYLPTYVSSHTNDTIAVASAGVWYNVTFDHEADEFKRRITHTTDDDTNITFTIQDTGTYEITYTLSFQDSAVVPNSHVVTRVTNNNVELNGFTIEEDLGIQDQDKILYHSDLVELTVGDEIVLSFTSDDTTVSLTSHLTYGIHRNTAHLTIKRIA